MKINDKLKRKIIFILIVCMISNFTFPSGDAPDKYMMADTKGEYTVIEELTGDRLTQYANTGGSLDNMKPFCYGWMIHSKDKKERPMYTQVTDGCIVFQAEKDEFLPGGYLFAANGESGLRYTMGGLEANQQVKIAYVINIDPISKGYTNRLLNFEIEGVGRETIGLAEGAANSWGDPNDLIIPEEYLGKDLRIVFRVPASADKDGVLDLNLINYSAAHYPLFMDDEINIELDGFNAPFKMVIKAVQFLGKEAPDGIQVMEEGFGPKEISEVPKQEFTSNLERVKNDSIYTQTSQVPKGFDDMEVIIIILGVIGFTSATGLAYFIGSNRKSRRKDEK